MIYFLANRKTVNVCYISNFLSRQNYHERLALWRCNFKFKPPQKPNLLQKNTPPLCWRSIWSLYRKIKNMGQINIETEFRIRECVFLYNLFTNYCKNMQENFSSMPKLFTEIRIISKFCNYTN